jgi:hypothetical protein
MKPFAVLLFLFLLSSSPLIAQNPAGDEALSKVRIDGARKKVVAPCAVCCGTENASTVQVPLDLPRF